MRQYRVVPAQNANQPPLELLWARLETVVLAAVDMVDVAETCRYLLGDHPEAKDHGDGAPWRVRRTLETGLFVTYARPFAISRKGGHLSRAGGLSENLRKYHDEIVERRNTVYATLLDPTSS